jgi:hypothetical protein
VQEDAEEPGDDVEVDDVEGGVWVGVVDFGDDAALLVSML